MLKKILQTKHPGYQNLQKHPLTYIRRSVWPLNERRWPVDSSGLPYKQYQNHKKKFMNQSVMSHRKIKSSKLKCNMSTV